MYQSEPWFVEPVEHLGDGAILGTVIPDARTVRLPFMLLTGDVTPRQFETLIHETIHTFEVDAGTSLPHNFVRAASAYAAGGFVTEHWEGARLALGLFFPDGVGDAIIERARYFAMRMRVIGDHHGASF